VDAKKKTLVLSLKKSLLAAKTPPVTHPSAVTPGTRTHGWITGITDAGVFISLYNRIEGLVPKRTIDLSTCNSLKDLYSVGQVVKCTIIRGDSAKGLILSLEASGAAAAAATAAVEASKKDVFAGLESGMVVLGAVVTAIQRVGEAQSGGVDSEQGGGVKEQKESDSDDGTLLVFTSGVH
jgi:ribosomal protein S1